MIWENLLGDLGDDGRRHLGQYRQRRHTESGHGRACEHGEDGNADAAWVTVGSGLEGLEALGDRRKGLVESLVQTGWSQNVCSCLEPLSEADRSCRASPKICGRPDASSVPGAVQAAEYSGGSCPSRMLIFT